MDVIKGKTLRKQDRSTTLDAESVLKDKKLVLFYFSAHWCPPCRLFTPILKDFYAVIDAFFLLHCSIAV